MSLAGTKSARPTGRHGTRGPRSSRPVVVARATLAVPLPPPVPGAAEDRVEDRLLARRADLHVARRQRRRDALLGLGVLAGALGAAVFVVDVLH
jgi:hypothetical protein